MHNTIDRIAHTTAFVTPVVEHWLEREIAQWVHPRKDRSDDPSHHERTLLPQELHLAPPRSVYAGGSPCFDELTETGNSVFGRGDVAEPFRFNREVLRTF